MGFYIDRENYFKGLAIDHHLVLDSQPVSDEDETPRRSFFRLNNEEELLSASLQWIHFPCVVMVGYTGGFADKSNSIRQTNNNVLLFLERVVLDDENPIGADALSDTYEVTFNVMQDFISRIRKDYEDEDGCGIFKRIEAGSFKWLQSGPVADNLYGWELSFRDETRPKEYNPDNWGDNGGNRLLTRDDYALLAD